MTVLCSFELFSHPDKLLTEHLTNVAKMASKELLNKPMMELYGYSIERLATLMEFCGFCHDMGKSTKFFQRYLFASEQEKALLKSMAETHHGLLSAIITYFCVRQYFNDEFLSFLAYMVVKRHHGNFRGVLEESRISEKDIYVLKTQIDNIAPDKFNKMISKISSNGFKGKLSAKILPEWLNNFPDEMRRLRRILRRLDRQEDIMPYVLFNFLFSILIDSDKTDAVFSRNIKRAQLDLDEEIVDLYKANFFIDKRKLDLLREEAYLDIMNVDIDLNDKIYSINLPTGMGKTLSSFAFALKLRNRIAKEKGYIPRIIYSLPFLSIIEQNGKVYEKVLENASIPAATNVLLKHHHLTDIYYDDGENEFDTHQAKFLIEGWNGEIIITTFVQFFHTLMTNRNSALRKFHKIAGSIVLLDEIQSIPVKYWMLLEYLFKILANYFECYFVFITATDPYIIDRTECTALTDTKKYFQSKELDRVLLKPLLGRDMTLEEFIDFLELEEDKSYLFVLNTINSAKQFYELLRARVGNSKITYLSTHVTPKERLSRIKDMKEKKYCFAVTTQLIEAGVDIDYDIVYRDFAPLDSINQTAGRCNREGEGKGEVYIVSLCDENRRYAEYVYDSVLLDITKGLLINRKSIAEGEFLNLIEEYYRQVKDRKSFNESRLLLNAVYQMKYTSIDGSHCIADFKLIDEDIPRIGVFVELDEDGEKLWRMYMELKEIENPVERKIKFDSFRAEFYQYVISVPVTVKNLPVIVEGFAYINRNSLSDYYDPVTGYICEDKLLIW